MKILDDSIYKAWFEMYVACTEEYEKLVPALKNIINTLPLKETFLDIGAGNGYLTFKICQLFNKVIVVEPNELVRGIFEHKKIEFIQGYFTQVDLGDNTFDFILCSHVFYLVKGEDRLPFLTKMYHHLSPQGKMAIVLISPQGQSYEFHKRFFFNFNTTTHDILKDLHRLGFVTEVFPISHTFGSDSFDDFFNICKLFIMQSWLHPVNVSDEEIQHRIGNIEQYTQTKLQEMTEYIRNNCYSNQQYTMNQEIDVLVVSK